MTLVDYETREVRSVAVTDVTGDTLAGVMREQVDLLLATVDGRFRVVPAGRPVRMVPTPRPIVVSVLAPGLAANNMATVID